MVRALSFVLFALAVSACGGGPPAAVPASTAQQEAIARIGDISVRATAIPTATLSPAVASQYGIARDDRTVMLLVAVRQGTEGLEASLPATITATATNLSGQRQVVALRQLHSVDPGSGQALVDHIGLVETSLPDTLRFDVNVAVAGGSTRLQFSREFHPR